MKTVVGKTVIQLLLERLSLSKRLDEIVVATSTESSDDALVEHLKKISVKYFRGSEADVLSRFMGAAETYSADVIVRITGDCPLVDSNLVDFCIDKFCASSCDYLSNIDPPSFPDGLDVEVFSISALRSAFAEATTIFDREHVTPYLRTNARYSRERVLSEVDYSLSRWTLDEQTDFEVIENVFKHFSPRIDFNWLEVRDLQKSNPKIFSANSELKRDGGASMGSGQKLWRRAKQVIPGGNMLLSKRSEMFLPDQWPAYFSKVKGCRVWDLDGNEFIDMSIMGIGTNILGYGDEEVDNAVRSVVDNGNMSTLNCPEEVFLAERLIELHPWADMVRFARSGGEANSIAIRIARAAVGKSKVAICGYHGWHDWYLSANLGDEKNLAGHLLPGLEPNGVPEELRGTVLPFVYNDFDGLEALIQKNDIGVIKMEVSRNFGPENGFLERVRELATKKGIVLIFDECTSGFRQSFGGIHKIYGVEPDMAMFGKAMGNGYAITAVIGRREIMQSAQTSFISSTFWTERIGPVAGLKTLEVMERTKSWELISEIGVNVAHRWRDLAQKNGVSISISGIKALPMFSFDSTKALEFKTYLTQEMLARGFLATTSLYASVAHTPELIERYFDNLGSVFETISKCEEGLDISTLLNGPVAHSGFKRLN